MKGGPADEAGIEGGDNEIDFQGQEVEAGGDVIVAVDGEEIVGEADLPRLISQHDPRRPSDARGHPRRRARRRSTSTLGERPENV